MRIFSANKHHSSALDAFSNKLVQATGTSASDFLLIEPYSIGDLVQDLLLLPEFRRRHCYAGQKINLICNQRAAALVNLFPYVDQVFGMNCASMEAQLSAVAERYGPCATGAPILLAPDMYARGWLGRLSAAGALSPITAKKLILELDLEAPLTIPPLQEGSLREAALSAESQELQPQSIIIFNHAKTVKPLEADAFSEVLDLFPGRVFYDASVPDAPPVAGAIPLKMSLEQIPYFAALAGSVITLRSGITDLLCMAPVSLTTVYPRATQFYDWAGDKAVAARAFKNLTLERLGLNAICNESAVFYEDGDSILSLARKIGNAVSTQQRP